MSKKSLIKLSVIIVSYRNLGVLRNCLDSIQKFNDIGNALEVIVVEQSPRDNIYQSLLSDYQWVKVVKNENRGFGAGNNRGAKEARGEYLLFINPDTVLVEPIFGFAVEKFEHDSQMGLFGVQLVDALGRRNRSFHFRKPWGLWRIAAWRLCDQINLFLPHAMYTAGADMFIRASAFQEAGGFDERMFMYYEETYLCNQLNKHGMKIAYFPQKKIVHLEGRSSANVQVFKRQLDSLTYLCEESGCNYIKVLKHLEKDRKMKRLLGLHRQEDSDEINEIEMRLCQRCGN